MHLDLPCAVSVYGERVMWWVTWTMTLRRGRVGSSGVSEPAVIDCRCGMARLRLVVVSLLL